MKSSVFWALVRKDLYLMRGFMTGAVIGGVLAIVLMKFGKVGFAVGGILFLTTNVASGIFIAMYTMLTERKDHSRVFAMSLPITGFHYGLTKLVGGSLTYTIPWLVMTGLAVGIFFLPGAERGMIVYALVLQGFVLALFAVVLAALFVITSETTSGISILVVNIAFSLFMVTLSQPQNSGPFHGPAIVWTPYAVHMLTGEALAILLSVSFALYISSRKRDYI